MPPECWQGEGVRAEIATPGPHGGAGDRITVQPPDCISAAGRTVTRSLVIRTSQSPWQRGQRNQALWADRISASEPPRRVDGTRLPVQPQAAYGQTTG